MTDLTAFLKDYEAWRQNLLLNPDTSILAYEHYLAAEAALELKETE